MGKMKEVFMELREKQGYDVDNTIFDYSYDEYLSELNKSACCGADLNKIADETGSTWGDYGICPNCLDNCN